MILKDKISGFNMMNTVENGLHKAIEMGFSATDFVQIYEHGISLENIQNQLNYFKNGISKTFLHEAATINNGILKLSENDFEQKADYFDSIKSNLKLEKFVPASGAATRMFKFLSVFLDKIDIEKESINAYINKNNDNELSIFIESLDKFPFFDEVHAELQKSYSDFNNLTSDFKNYYFIQLLLSPAYFDFANKPKGILPFHQYFDHIATPIEEHLNECVHYSSSNGSSNLHFTVSETHLSQFESIINSVENQLEEKTGVNIKTRYSFQHKTTDTIAVDTENKPFRDNNGALIFRPGGHGALIENLNALNADIVFIKNIDNVIQNHIEKISFYKKALAGILLELQKEVFYYLNLMESLIEFDLNEIITFCKNKLNVELESEFFKFSFESKITHLRNIFNRPIRVCGMVKNEGEPGGGPFWVKDSNGNVSLQIVETSQVDLTNSNQAKILENATHFNPVDLVCGIKNFKNEKFDLTKYIDHDSGFIVEKNKEGRDLKGYELPGLWNGAMAKWITVFVEVPIITFNPVKTVNDLLKSAHQPQ